MARGAAAGLSLPSWHGREGIGIALARMDVAMSVEFADLCCALQWCYGFRAHAEGNLADAVGESGAVARRGSALPHRGIVCGGAGARGNHVQ